MLDWELRWGAVRGAEAANEAWPVFTRRQEVTVERAGRYIRVVLTKRVEPALPQPRPEWA